MADLTQNPGHEEDNLPSMENCNVTLTAEEAKILDEFLSSFTGSFDHSLDAKGRMVVPQEFRSKLGESFVLVPGFDFQSIDLYPTLTWAKKRAHYGRIAKSELTQKGLRWIDSFTYNGMVFDGQGRILVPAKVRALVLKDEKDVVVSGAGDHASIVGRSMNKAQFEQYLSQLPEMFAQLDKMEISSMEKDGEG